MLLFFSNCATGEDSPQADAGSPRHPLPAEQQNLNVAYSGESVASNQGKYLGRFEPTAGVYDTLVNADEQYRVGPMLAERWELLDGTNTVRFHLRKGVKFHDGSELTAEDVKFSIEFYQKNRLTTITSLAPDGIKVVDQYTVDMTTKETDQHIVEELAHPSLGIAKKDSNPADPSIPLIGTGPFRFVEYEPQKRLVVERFPEYWDQSGLGKISRITFNFVSDVQTRLLGLRSGEFHVIGGVPAAATRELAAIPNAERALSRPGTLVPIDFNINGPEPYVLGKDPLVRQAVSLSVDQEALRETVYGDTAVPGAVIPDLFPDSAVPVTKLGYDPEQGRRLLEQAGWRRDDDGIRTKDGRRLSLVYMSNFGGEAAQLTGEVLQNQLKEVGVEIRLDTNLDPGIAQARRRNGEYDLLARRSFQTEAGPCFLYDFVFASPAIGGFQTFHAPGGRVDEEIVACRTTTVPDEMRKHAAEIARLVVDDLKIRIPLGVAREIWGVTKGVEGFTPHPIMGRANWAAVSLVEE